MKIDLTPIIQAIIVLIAAIITAHVIPWLKRKIGAQKLTEAKTWVEVAVKAAEQLYQGDGRGAEKYNYVVKFLQDKGFTFDGDSIKNLIESTVGDLLNVNLNVQYEGSLNTIPPPVAESTAPEISGTENKNDT
jgi:hypothetical protein